MVPVTMSEVFPIEIMKDRVFALWQDPSLVILQRFEMFLTIFFKTVFLMQFIYYHFIKRFAISESAKFPINVSVILHRFQ